MPIGFESPENSLRRETPETKPDVAIGTSYKSEPDLFVLESPKINLFPLSPVHVTPTNTDDSELAKHISSTNATLFKNVNSQSVIDLKSDNENFLFPIQTPSIRLIKELENMSAEDMQPYLQHYSAIAAYAQNPANGVVLDGQDMLLVPSMRGYFSDISEEAGHVLCLPRQSNHAKEIVQTIQEIIDKKQNPGLDNDTNSEELKSLYERLRTLSSSVQPVPRNEPQTGMLLEMLDKPLGGTIERIFGQNCAPGSASCPSNLHLQVLPREAFPLLELEASKRFIGEVSSLKIGEKTLSVQGVNAPGTVLGINVSGLDPEELRVLGHSLNAVVKSQTNPNSFGVDFMTSTEKDGEKFLYIAFRNQEKGGLYQSFGIFDSSKLQNLDPASSDTRTDQYLSQLSEPIFQVDTAAFLAKLKRKLLQPIIDRGADDKSQEP